MFNIKLGEKYRSKTISAVLVLLSSVIEHAYQNEVLTRNRAKGIEPVKSNKPKFSKERYIANKDKSYTEDAWLLVEQNEEPFYVEKINIIFIEIKKITGINITPHILRHFFATQAQSTNINPRLIANFLGYTNISMTDHYTHATDEGGIFSNGKNQPKTQLVNTAKKRYNTIPYIYLQL